MTTTWLSCTNPDSTFVRLLCVGADTTLPVQVGARPGSGLPYNEAKLTLDEDRLGCVHGPGVAGDLDGLTSLTCWSPLG